jgi:hypothetical protein
VAVSPDVGSFIGRRFDCCDLLRRSVIRNVARKASSVTLTTGMAPDVTCWAAVPKMEALAPVPRLRPGFSFCAASVGGVVGTLEPSVCHFGSTRLVSV